MKGFWGQRAERLFSPFRTVRTAKTPDSLPREPALRSPRRRGVWLPTTPLFPSLLGPLEAAVGGLSGEGRTPRSGPRLGTPGRIPFHPREAPLPPPLLAGFMRGSPGSTATLCGPAPAPGPSGAFPCAKGNFREGGGPVPSAEGVSGGPPLGPQPQMNRRGQDFYSSRSFSTPTRTSVLMSSWLIPVVSSTLSHWTLS